MSHTPTISSFHGIACGTYFETSGKKITVAYASVLHPAKYGHLCIRGWHGGNAFLPKSWSEVCDSLKNATRYLTNKLAFSPKHILKCLVQIFHSISAEVKDGA